MNSNTQSVDNGEQELKELEEVRRYEHRRIYTKGAAPCY